MIKKLYINTTAAILVSVSIFLSGCSETPVSNTAKNANTNQSAVTNTNAPMMNTNIAVNTPAANAPAMNANAASTQNANVVSTVNNSSTQNANRKPAQAMKEPQPQIGSGANDLLLFTQARSALSFDNELQGGVIIEVKEGNVTLSGKAASAELKARAEQAIKAVNGVKSVKNNITVSK